MWAKDLSKDGMEAQDLVQRGGAVKHQHKIA